MKSIWLTAALGAVLTLSACIGAPQSRMGMVVDEETGIMYGSAIEKNILVDPTFYTNRQIKVRTRNTSGDTQFNLANFKTDLDTAYAGKGYEPTGEDDFGLLVDVNVMYSGQAQTNSARHYAWLGAMLGATYGGETPRGVIAATAAGAELGRVIGSFNTEDTYMVVARVTFGVIKPYKSSRKRVTFSRSTKIKDIDDPNEDEKIYRNKFKKTFTTEVAVYAGGRNLSQSEIVEEVRKRAVRIVADFI